MICQEILLSSFGPIHNAESARRPTLAREPQISMSTLHGLKRRARTTLTLLATTKLLLTWPRELDARAMDKARWLVGPGRHSGANTLSLLSTNPT